MKHLKNQAASLRSPPHTLTRTPTHCKHVAKRRGSWDGHKSGTAKEEKKRRTRQPLDKGSCGGFVRVLHRPLWRRSSPPRHDSTCLFFLIEVCVLFLNIEVSCQLQCCAVFFFPLRVCLVCAFVHVFFCVILPYLYLRKENERVQDCRRRRVHVASRVNNRKAQLNTAERLNRLLIV
jgi:hypothetical protein